MSMTVRPPGPLQLRGLMALAGTALAGHRPRPAGRVLTPAAGGVAVIGHRGAAGLAPENTRSSFRVAAGLGVALELDVSLSEDGELVVIHDDTLDRTTSGSGPIATTPWDRISGLDAGGWFGAEWAGETVPRLVDVLDEFGSDVVIDIENKPPPKRTPVEPLAEAVVAAVQAAGLSQRVFVTSFNPTVLEAVRHADPRILRGQLVSTFDGTDLSLVERVVLRNLWLNRKAHADLLVAGAPFLRQRGSRYVRTMKRWGYAVVVWTINRPEVIVEMAELGVDGVITDRPDVALETLQAWAAGDMPGGQGGGGPCP